MAELDKRDPGHARWVKKIDGRPRYLVADYDDRGVARVSVEALEQLAREAGYTRDDNGE